MPEPTTSLPLTEWPYFSALMRLGLALFLGLFVGLERERRRKDAGVRTFAFAAIIGCLGGLLGEYYALIGLGFLALLVIVLNVESLLNQRTSELTTSAALFVIGLTGILCGLGHTLTPTALAVMTAALLMWKERLAGFSLGVTDAELQSAILLAILAFVIYPALPETTIDPWNLINPRSAWVTVLLIAAIGFGNYILLKLYGTRAIEMTGLLGGLVNSTVTVTALTERVKADPSLIDPVYRGIMLATLAMLVRNFAILGFLAPEALITASPSLFLMLVVCLPFSLNLHRSQSGGTAPIQAEFRSPFSLASAFKFGLVFLVLEIAGTLGQTWLGHLGFYTVSFLGGLISSASAVASAGSLSANGTISPKVAGVGAVLASLTSAFVTLPLVARVGHERPLTRKITWSLMLVLTLGLIGTVMGSFIPDEWLHSARKLIETMPSRPTDG